MSRTYPTFCTRCKTIALVGRYHDQTHDTTLYYWWFSVFIVFGDVVWISTVSGHPQGERYRSWSLKIGMQTFTLYTLSLTLFTLLLGGSQVSRWHCTSQFHKTYRSLASALQSLIQPHGQLWSSFWWIMVFRLISYESRKFWVHKHMLASDNYFELRKCKDAYHV